MSEIDLRYQSERRRDFEREAEHHRNAKNHQDSLSPETQVMNRVPMQKVTAFVTTVLNAIIR